MDLFESLVKMLKSKKKGITDIEVVRDISRPNLILEPKSLIIFLSSMGKDVPMKDMNGILGLEIYGKDWKIYFEQNEDKETIMKFKRQLVTEESQ